MTTTIEQEYIIDKAIKQYYYGNDNLFQYDGEAGTGKTYTMCKIIERLGLKPNEILPVAYTGQAACVMRTKGLYNSRTIDSGLYFYEPILDTGNMSLALNRPKKKYKRILRDLKKEGIKLILVDEGPMIPIDYRQDILKQGLFTIVTGDLGQLHTITGQPAFLTTGNIYHLTVPMRQNANKAIYYLAKRARSGLPIHCGHYGDVLVITDNELTDEMLKWANIVICGRNKTRDIMNKRIRENIYNIHRDVPIRKERLICKKNNWGIEIDGINLVNGLIGTVTNMPTVEQYDNKTFGIDFRPDLCINTFKNIRVNYQYFTAPTVDKQTIKDSPYLEGECFEYAYCTTTHSSQGSEHYQGIYIEEPWSQEIANQLNYVGITRFKKKLIYVKKSNKFY